MSPVPAHGMSRMM